MRYTALILALIAGAVQSGEVLRVDPPFWWLGFEEPRAQLLLQGENINNMQVSVQAKGIAIDQIVSTDNPDYLFVYLRFGDEAKPGEIKLRLTGQEGWAEVSYELRQKNPDPDHARGFSSKDTIYLITPDRFANGDPGNDRGSGQDRVDREDPEARHGGDLLGITQNLGYIKDMGFTAIWMNPVLENAMPSHSYHGYAVTDLYRVDPRFGSNQDYQELANRARKMGIGIIQDIVLNHIGSEHPWLDSLPHAEWLNARGEELMTNHAHTAVQDPYATPEDLRNLVEGWFVPVMPDMNQRNPLLADYLIQHSLWWIEYLGLAGIRTDTWPYSDKDFLARWTRTILREYPRFNIVGEEWHINPAILSYWQKGKINHDGYVSHLPSLMDFPLQTSLIKALTDTPAWGSPWRSFYELLGTDFLYPNPNNLVIFGDNHDMDRLYTQVGEDYQLFRLAITGLATMRGIPKLFYGTEILMSNPNHPGNHGVIRSDFPGGWQGDAADGFSGKGLNFRQTEARNLVKKLFSWRKNKSVLHDGKLMHLAPEGEVHVYFRYDEKDAVAVFLNRGDSEAEVSADRFRLFVTRYGNRWKDLLKGKRVNIESAVKVPAKSPVILESIRSAKETVAVKS